MGRKSTIDRLPEGVRKTIGELLANGRTLDEILAKLEELNVNVSRSALGRHAKKLEEVIEDLNRAQMMATAIADRTADKPVDDVHRANVQLMHASIQNLIIAKKEGEGLSVKDTAMVAIAMEKVTKARAIEQKRVIEITKELGQKVGKAIDGVAQEVAEAEKPASADDVLKRIREEVYGIFDKPQ
jgi:hypothetical protein